MGRLFAHNPGQGWEFDAGDGPLYDSVVRINADLVRQRAKEIRDALEVLGRYRGLSREEFLASPETVDAAKYRLVVSIEAAVSI